MKDRIGAMRQDADWWRDWPPHERWGDRFKDDAMTIDTSPEWLAKLRDSVELGAWPSPPIALALIAALEEARAVARVAGANETKLRDALESNRDLLAALEEARAREHYANGTADANIAGRLELESALEEARARN